METRLSERQKRELRNEFADHPFFLMCHDSFLRYQRELAVLRPEPVEIFCCAAEIMDDLLEDRHRCGRLLRTLWDSLCLKMREWAPKADDAEYEQASACICMAVITALSASSDQRHSYTLVRHLIGHLHEHFGEQLQPLEHALYPTLDYHQKELRQWMNGYISSDDYLSDEIQGIVKRKRGGRSSENPKDADTFKPDRATFIKTALIMDAHLALVHRELVSSLWIAPDTSSDDFLNLFCGMQNSVKIVWTGKEGRGSLCALFEMMLKENFICCPEGHTYQKMLCSHFVDELGNYLKGLNKVSPSKKCQSVVTTCKSHLSTNVESALNRMG